MSSLKPLLTIVIPTKNRYRTLLPLCEYLIEKKGDFEIIISDNSESNLEFLSFIKDKCTKKLTYVHSKNSLSMRENCERGIKLAKGEYITMIGDDDGVIVDSAIDCIHCMKDMNLDFALSNDCKYLWPGLKTKLFGTKEFGILRYLETTKKSKLIKANKALKNVADIGGVTIGDMPRLYQGIVKTSFVLQAISENESVFLASMPDMSSSTLLATKMNDGIKFKMPFIVNGVSSNSGGGLGAAGKHKGKLDQGYGLSKEDIDEWPDLVPSFWSGGTVWAASYLITLQKLEYNNVIKFNKSSLLAYCIVFQPALLKEYFEKSYIREFLKLNFHFKVLVHIFMRAKAFFKNYYFYYFKIEDCKLHSSYELLKYIESKIKR